MRQIEIRNAAVRVRTVAVTALAGVAACSSSPKNAPRLWLTLVGPESQGVMALVENEPNTY